MKKAIVFLPRLLLLLSLTFLLNRCNKDDETPETNANRILGNWSLTADSYSPAYDFLGNGTTVTEAYPLYEACQKDDIYTFNSSNTGELNEGPTKCDPGDDQSYPFTWLLKSNGTVLNLSVNYSGITIGQDFNILQLDANTMKLQYTFDDAGVTYTNTQTFAHK